jgi:hypothetical protein
MVNPWIQHIKQYAKESGKSYGCALSDPECKSSYKEKKGMSGNDNPAPPETRTFRKKRVPSQKPPTSSESTSSAGASEYINKVRFYKKVPKVKQTVPEVESSPRVESAPKKPRARKPRAELPKSEPERITFRKLKKK